MSTCLNHGQPCDDCGSSDALATYTNNTYCFSCGTYRKSGSLFTPIKDKPKWDGTLPDDIESYLPNSASAWFSTVGIYPSTIKRNKIGYSPSMAAIIIPLYIMNKLVGYQVKPTINKSVKYYTIGKRYPYICHATSKNSIVFVEDIRSALKINQLGYTSVAILGTKLTNITFLMPLVNIQKNVFIWLDGDSPGIEGARKLYNKLAYISNVKLIKTIDDPKWYSNTEIEEILS